MTGPALKRYLISKAMRVQKLIWIRKNMVERIRKIAEKRIKEFWCVYNAEKKRINRYAVQKHASKKKLQPRAVAVELRFLGDYRRKKMREREINIEKERERLREINITRKHKQYLIFVYNDRGTLYSRERHLKVNNQGELQPYSV